MDPGCNKFGRGPIELTGALDLVSHYKLLPHHEFFCKRARPVSVLDTHYLYNVVGDREIRKGEGMQLDQLVQNTSSRNTNACIQPFNLDVLGEAFYLRETAPVDLPPSEKGTPTIAGKSKSESKDKDKHKKQKDKDKEKDKERKKHKHRHKDRSKEKKDKKKDKEKIKKRDGDEKTKFLQKHKKSKA